MAMATHAAALGAASGLRTTAGPARLSAHLSRGARDGEAGAGARLLALPGTRDLLAIALLGELAIDKLPILPARIRPAPLLGRAGSGGLAGGVLAVSRRRSGVEGALFGALGALAGAFAGYHLRRVLTRRLGLPDLPVALAEDLVAVRLAAYALRHPPGVGRTRPGAGPHRARPAPAT